MKRALTTLALLLLLAGCGGNDSSDKVKDDADGSSGIPKCSDVWQAGNDFPAAYDGCMNDGELEAGISYDCKDGTSLYVRNDTFWTEDGKVVQGSADEYSAAFDRCKGL